MRNLSKEQVVLMNLIRGRTNVLIENVDIDIILKQLYRHKLLSLSNVLINETKNTDKNRIKEELQEWSFRSLLLTNVVVNLNREFIKNSIESIFIKGPVLAYQLYKDVGGRYYTDLDLLVRNIYKAIEILVSMGFNQIHPQTDLSEKQWDYYYRWKKDIRLVNREKGVFVELHIGIYYHVLLSREKEALFFEDLAEEILAGTTVRCMNRDNTFLYLTYHGAQHMYFRMFWLRDVAEALKRWDLDHTKILRNAYDLGIERLLGVSLELAREIFQAKIPEEYHVLLAKKRAIIKKLKKLCLKRILGPEELKFAGKLQKHYYIMSLKPGFRYKWVALQSIFHRWYIRKFLGGN